MAPKLRRVILSKTTGILCHGPKKANLTDETRESSDEECRGLRGARESVVKLREEMWDCGREISEPKQYLRRRKLLGD